MVVVNDDVLREATFLDVLLLHWLLIQTLFANENMNPDPMLTGCHVQMLHKSMH